MTSNDGTATRITDHSGTAEQLLRVLENFADEFLRRGVPVHLNQVINEGQNINGKKIGQEPERFVEEHLIWPSLEAFGYEYWPQPYYYPRWDRLTPDFGVQNFECGFDCTVFGEVKVPNNFDEAKRNIYQYLNSDRDEPAIAFATDGVKWRIFARPAKEQYETIASVDLSDAFALLPLRYKEQESYDAFQTRQLMGDVDMLRKIVIETKANQLL
ncbi:hypothetical protein [Halomontanus rarus]|uniref:hypothetical protein n=1 Tax=Halomontanus rarus TaxID=3034020 RepID=UPI00307CA310